MLHLTLLRRSIAGAAVASAMFRGSPNSTRNLGATVNPYHTIRARVSMPPPPQPPLMPRPSTPSEARLKEFKRFYETVTRSREATSLPPTPLGHGGSERILNNEFLHESPWQASCVELRERAVVEEKKVLSYDNIDFASLRRQHRRARPAVLNSGSAGSYSNVEDMRPKSGEQQQGPGLDVVHYYETSSPAGLAGYQRVAMDVRKGLLPGSCTNFSAEGGFAVWVVPLTEYTATMSTMGLLPK